MRGGPLLLVLLLCAAPLVAAVPPESVDFSQTFEEETFTIGSATLSVDKADGSGEQWDGALYYPSENGSGAGADFNSSDAPFPILIFWVDAGEDVDNYDWIIEMASAGYIIIIAPSKWDNSDPEEILDDFAYLILKLNETNSFGTSDGSGPANMIGAFDIPHWGVAGHGTGAMTAALVNVMWMTYSGTTDIWPPRSLFALGIDVSGTSLAQIEAAAIAEPSLALFITGTADEITDATEHLDEVVDIWPGGWLRMDPMGANHIQYQDESTLAEWWDDGSGNMSRTEQQSHAMQHLVPYLDLTLKGDHSQWFNASNRDIDLEGIADEDAYVNESLAASRMLKLIETMHEDGEIWLNQSVPLQIQVSHRDESAIAENGTRAWCEHWNGTRIDGEFNDSEDRASCIIDSNSLQPGQQNITLFASWYGMQTSYTFTLYRGNTPIEMVEPTPVIRFDQHGSTIVPTSLFASDPDGLDLVFINATLNGEGADNLSLLNNGTELIISHSGEPEWNGSLGLDMWISETSSPADSVNISTVITLLPVDDMVVNTAQVPQQSFDEDSDGVHLNISQWFEDPENSTLHALGSSGEANISIDWQDGLLHISAAENWSGAAMLNISVSDGNTTAVWDTFPVVVNPMPDAPVFTLLELDNNEDEVKILPLSSFAEDSDGDQLTYEFSIDRCGGQSNISITIEGDDMMMVQTANWYGFDECWNLTVSDGIHTIARVFDVSIISVDDPTSVTWHEPEVREDGNLTLGFTLYDADEPAEHTVRIAWREDDWLLASNSACLEWSEGAIACTLLLQPLFSSPGQHDLWLTIETQPDATTPVEKLTFVLVGDEQTENVSEAEEVDSIFDDIKVRIAVGAVLFIVIVAFLGNIRRSPASKVEQVDLRVVQTSQVEADEPELIEVVEEDKPSGLLELARRNR